MDQRLGGRSDHGGLDPAADHHPLERQDAGLGAAHDVLQRDRLGPVAACPGSAEHGQGLGEAGLLGGRVVGLEQALQQGRVVVGALHLVQQGLLVVGHDEDPAGHAEEGPLGGGVEFVVLLGGGQFGAAAGEFGRELFPEAVALVFLLGDPTALGGGDRAVAGGGHQGESGEHACCRCAPLSHRHAANSRAMIL